MSTHNNRVPPQPQTGTPAAPGLAEAALGVCHTLNNMLMVASANLELLADSHQAPSGPRMTQAYGAIEKAQHQVACLTALARSHALPQQHMELPLADIVRTTLKRARSHPSLLGCTIKLREQDQQAVVNADRELLEAALLNLLTNAGEATKGQGLIVVRTFARRSRRRCGVEVLDRGPGLPVAGDRVFDLFYTTRGSIGHGVGLYLVRSVAESCGGRVEAHNRRGGGARFVLLLPASFPDGEHA